MSFEDVDIVIHTFATVFARILKFLADSDSHSASDYRVFPLLYHKRRIRDILSKVIITTAASPYPIMIEFIS
jgi:hypothetical protein